MVLTVPNSKICVTAFKSTAPVTSAPAATTRVEGKSASGADVSCTLKSLRGAISKDVSEK